MPAFHVSRSITIAAPVATVFDLVEDFRRSREWSPWLITDPEARFTASADGKSYAWQGSLCGAGENRITEVRPPHSLRSDLVFLKPWKSRARVGFDLKEKDGGTEVTWWMDSRLPFFLFWMKPMMTALIGGDYHRGLLMLKDLVETGSVPCRLDFPGITGVEAVRYFGIRTACPISQIASHMERNFERLLGHIRDSGLRPVAPPVSIYHRWDLGGDQVEYTVGVPLEMMPEPLPKGFTTAEIPSCRAYEIRFTGAYRHLGAAWSAGMVRARNKVFRPAGIPPWEEYLTDPQSTAENQHQVSVRFAVKS